MRLRIFLRSFILCSLFITLAAVGQPQVQKLIGAGGADDGFVVLATPDGGCLIGGQTLSFGAGLEDVFLVKFTSTFSIEWARVLGGPGVDWLNRLLLTPDSAVLCAGYTSVAGNGMDGWLFKMDLSGSLRWSKRFGASGDDLLADVIPDPAGGYLVAGHATSYGVGGYDIWAMRVNDAGEILSAHTYGGFSTEAMNKVIPTADGGFMIAGHTYSYGVGLHDIALLKLGASLELQWMKTYGTGLDETAYVIRQRPDGGYVIVGGTHAGAFGGRDGLIMRVDTGGAFLSAGSVGTVGEDQLVRGVELEPTGLAISGWVADGSGVLDGWFATVSDDGVLSHSTRLGGTAFDRFIGIARTPSGQLLISGSSASSDSMGTQAYLVRMSLDGPPMAGASAAPSTVTPTTLAMWPQALYETTPTIAVNEGPDSAVAVSFTVSDLFEPQQPTTPHVFIPPVFSRAGDPVSIPVMLSSPFGVAGADLAIQLDTSVVVVHGVRRGSLSGLFALAFNVSRPDSVLISLASGTGILQSQPGSLVILDGSIRPGVPDSVEVPVHFTRVNLYDALSQPLVADVTDGVLRTGFGRKGDVNADQLVNAADAIIVLRMAAEVEVRNERDRWAADFDGNGLITPYDAVGVLRAAVGLSTPPPVDTISTPVRVVVQPISASSGQVIDVPIRIEGMPGLVSGMLEFDFNSDQVEVRDLRAREAFGGLLQLATPTSSRIKVAFASSSAWDRTGADVAAVEVQARQSLNSFLPSFIGGSLTDVNGRSINTFQFVTVGVEENGPVRSFALHPNHPNPFNPSTMIRFDVSRPSRVRILVRNLLGQTVAELLDDVRPAGTYEIPWHAEVGTGIYFCTMQALDATTGQTVASFTQKMLLLK